MIHRFRKVFLSPGTDVVRNAVTVLPSLENGWVGSNEVSPQTAGFPGARWHSTPATRRQTARTCNYRVTGKSYIELDLYQKVFSPNRWPS